MILNALRLMVEAIEAFGPEEGVRFWSRTRKRASMATSVLPFGKDNLAGAEEQSKPAYSTGGSYCPKGCQRHFHVK